MPYYNHPRPSVTVDCVLLGIAEETLQALFIRRKKDPFKGYWALPGGFMEIDETPGQAVTREVKEETGVHIERVMQIGAFGAVNRDPRGRTISIAFLAFLNNDQKAKAASDAAEVKWISLNTPLELAFDHKEILGAALKWLSEKKVINQVSLSLDLKVETTESLMQAVAALKG